MKPLIGITSATVYNRDMPYSPFTYGQQHTYVEAITNSGGIPIIIPITRNSHEVKEIFERIDGFFFAGGNDISPSLYNEETHNAPDIDEARDQHEVEVMKLALGAKKPILAICRGMQMLNAIRGGTLYQDIATEIPTASNHVGYLEVKDPKYLIRTLTIEPESKLAKILSTTKILSNDNHHQAIKEVGDGLTVNAYAEDGVVEGLEDMRDGYIMGIESHPESIVGNVQPEWKPLFDSFVNACAQKSR